MPCEKPDTTCTAMHQSLKRIFGFLVALTLIVLAFNAAYILDRVWHSGGLMSRQSRVSMVENGGLRKWEEWPITCSQKQRLDVIREQCEFYNEGQGPIPPASDIKQIYRRLLVDDVHKTMYCWVAKVACSTFKVMLAETSPLYTRKVKGLADLVHQEEFLSDLGIRPLDTYNATEQHHRLDTYFKFLVVRHPFDRLCSTYADKFSKPPPQHYPYTFRQLIMERFHINTSVSNIDFSQFVSLIVGDKADIFDKPATDRGRHYFRNYHWVPYDDMCHPCHIQYDQIVKLETLGDDVKGIINRHPFPNGSFPSLGLTNQAREATNKLSAVQRAFRDVPKETISDLYRVYQRDFRFFGYRWNEVDGATCDYDADRCC